MNRLYRNTEIESSSMADIAFLLLIFFLVVSTIDQNKGLPIVLPEDKEPVKVHAKDLVKIYINNQRVLIDEQLFRPEEVYKEIKERRLKNPALLISIKTTRESAYGTYVHVLDQIREANVYRISFAD